jgi:hypothetical protein
MSESKLAVAPEDVTNSTLMVAFDGWAGSWSITVPSVFSIENATLSLSVGAFLSRLIAIGLRLI